MTEFSQKEKKLQTQTRMEDPSLKLIYREKIAAQAGVSKRSQTLTSRNPEQHV